MGRGGIACGHQPPQRTSPKCDSWNKLVRHTALLFLMLLLLLVLLLPLLLLLLLLLLHIASTTTNIATLLLSNCF